MVTAGHDLATMHPSGGTGAIGRIGARLAGRLVLWLRTLDSRHHLGRLSDRALADIGTTRADLATFARQRDPWRRLPADAACVLALGALIERVENWRARRRERLQVYRELMAYSDRELNELGLRRGDISEIARTS